jgi:branched-chain amino acid aminotransferase
MTSTQPVATPASASLPDESWPIAVNASSSPRSAQERAAILAEPGFGRYFTDHMVRAQWTQADGWRDAEVVAYAPLSLDPATNFIHYGQAIFEGLKAYRHADGSVWTFRPHANAERFQNSARRLAMAPLPIPLFLSSLEALVRIDEAWVPVAEECSLYLRPFMFSTEVGLGVRPANAYEYLLIASPAGAYFSGGIEPVSVWLSQEYVRAAPGGTGEAKCAGNYAASLVAQAQAAEHGCDQVVWLDAVERQWIEEMGGMNLYFVYGSGPTARIMTPELTGALLPGVTRASLLTLARDLGMQAEEGRISAQQWRDDCASGAITEVFACGTAAVVTPVGQARSAKGDWTIGDGQAGPITMLLREELLGIQTGEVPDRHNWLYRLA